MIRVATKEDLKYIAKVHEKCFPKSFTTILGHKLLENYYYEFMITNPELFLVSTDEQGFINGLCMGYYSERHDCIKNFMRNNRFRFIMRVTWCLLCFKKVAWQKLLSHLSKKKPSTTVDNSFKGFKKSECGDLLSICVLPEFRGGVYSRDLLEAFNNALFSNGRKVCYLSVFNDNERAIKFYEKSGFTLVRYFDGGRSRLYAKHL